MVITFKSCRARNQLLEKGAVYTFRLHYRGEGVDWANSGRGTKKIADVRITLVGIISIKNLKPYLKQSGFRTLREWKYKIQQLTPRQEINDSMEGYLYKVERLGPPLPRTARSECRGVLEEEK